MALIKQDIFEKNKFDIGKFNEAIESIFYYNILHKEKGSLLKIVDSKCHVVSEIIEDKDGKKSISNKDYVFLYIDDINKDEPINIVNSKASISFSSQFIDIISDEELIKRMYDNNDIDDFDIYNTLNNASSVIAALCSVIRYNYFDMDTKVREPFVSNLNSIALRYMDIIKTFLPTYVRELNGSMNDTFFIDINLISAYLEDLIIRNSSSDKIVGESIRNTFPSLLVVLYFAIYLKLLAMMKYYTSLINISNESVMTTNNTSIKTVLDLIIKTTYDTYNDNQEEIIRRINTLFYTFVLFKKMNDYISVYTGYDITSEKTIEIFNAYADVIYEQYDEADENTNFLFNYIATDYLGILDFFTIHHPILENNYRNPLSEISEAENPFTVVFGFYNCINTDTIPFENPYKRLYNYLTKEKRFDEYDDDACGEYAIKMLLDETNKDFNVIDSYRFYKLSAVLAFSVLVNTEYNIIIRRLSEHLINTLFIVWFKTYNISNISLYSKPILNTPIKNAIQDEYMQCINHIVVLQELLSEQNNVYKTDKTKFAIDIQTYHQTFEISLAYSYLYNVKIIKFFDLNNLVLYTDISDIVTMISNDSLLFVCAELLTLRDPRISIKNILEFLNTSGLHVLKLSKFSKDKKNIITGITKYIKKKNIIFNSNLDQNIFIASLVLENNDIDDEKNYIILFKLISMYLLHADSDTSLFIDNKLFMSIKNDIYRSLSSAQFLNSSVL